MMRRIIVRGLGGVVTAGQLTILVEAALKRLLL